MAVAKVMAPTVGRTVCSEGSASPQNPKYLFKQPLLKENSKKYCYKIKDQGTEDKPNKFMGVDVRKILKVCTSTPIKCSKDSSGKDTYTFQKMKDLIDAEVIRATTKVDKEQYTSKSGKLLELVQTSYTFELRLKCIGEQPGCKNADDAMSYYSPFREGYSELVNASYTDSSTYPV